MGVIMGRLVEAPYLALREKIAPSSRADLLVALPRANDSHFAATETSQQTVDGKIA
jgi:hypothetical protein